MYRHAAKAPMSATHNSAGATAGAEAPPLLTYRSWRRSARAGRLPSAATWR
jgi:hypothetical protein